MNVNEPVTRVARVLAGIDDDGNDGNSATAAWAELLSSAKHGDRHLASALEREYDLLGANGPDGSEQQSRRIEFLLHQMDSGALANAAAWLDDDRGQADDWTDSDPQEIDGFDDGDDLADDWTIPDPFDEDDALDTMQYSTGDDKPRKTKRTSPKADGSGEHWVTIGAVPGGDGKKHGGVPVLIRGGRIVDGPARLKGKKLASFGKDKKPDSKLDHAVRSAAKEHRLPVKDLRDAVHFVHSEKSQTHTERENAKAAARKMTGLTAGDISRLANAGHDYASAHKTGGHTGAKFRHFDEIAQEVAREHPELGLGDAGSKENFAESLWNVLAEGKREPFAKHHPDVIQEAVDLLRSARPMTKADKDRYAEMAAIPFSLSARSGADRRRTRGPAGVGALPDDRGQLRGVVYRRLPRFS